MLASPWQCQEGYPAQNGRWSHSAKNLRERGAAKSGEGDRGFKIASVLGFDCPAGYQGPNEDNPDAYQALIQ